MSTLKKTAIVREVQAPATRESLTSSTTTRVVHESTSLNEEGLVIVDSKEEKKDEKVDDASIKVRLSRAMKSLKGKDGQINNVYFALFFNQAVNNSAPLNAILAVNPGSTSDWGYITSLYDDFRIRKVQFEVYFTPMVAGYLGMGNLLGMAYDRDAVPGSAGVTMTSLVQYQNHKIYLPSTANNKFIYSHKITTPVTAAPSLTALPITINDWQPVNSASAFYYGGVYFSSALAFAASFNIPMVIKYWVDLRVRH